MTTKFKRGLTCKKLANDWSSVPADLCRYEDRHAKASLGSIPVNNAP
ncbi:hypothetical protein [Paraburkholderia heleia]|nr:hypothetical protein [Paraburkholderia heleia]